MDGTLVVSEVFGPTFQGEGPSAGQRCAFVRLGACNLHCTWCDTPYTWDSSRFDLREQLTRRPVAEIVAELEEMHAGLLVISGGEPLLQAKVGQRDFSDKPQGGFYELICWGVGRGRVEIETNGTVMPPAYLLDAPAVYFNVSPKLDHSGDLLDDRIKPAVLEQLSELEFYGRAAFKFVVRHDSDEAMNFDLAEIAGFVKRFKLQRVWVMPEGTTPQDILRGTQILADPVIERQWNLTTRLHTLAWGSERGK